MGRHLHDWFLNEPGFSCSILVIVLSSFKTDCAHDFEDKSVTMPSCLECFDCRVHFSTFHPNPAMTYMPVRTTAL